MTLVKNFLYLVGAEGVSKVLVFLAVAYLARVAGPVGFGYVEFASAALLCASLVVEQGFGPYGAREIARAPARTSALVAEIVLVRFGLALLAYATIAAFALLFAPSPLVTRLLLVYGLSLLLMPLLLQWVFQGHDQMHAVATMQLIRQGIYAATIFLLVREAGHLWFVAVAEVAAVASAVAYLLWLYRRRFGHLGRAPLRVTRRLFTEGVPIGLSQMFWMVRMFGATLILGLIAAAADVGYFAGALRILLAVHTFVFLYYFNLLPSISRAWSEGLAPFDALLRRSLRGVAWVSVIAALGWVLLAGPVMVAVYGAPFAPATRALQWFAGVCLCAALSGHYRFGLIAAGQQSAEMVIAALGAVGAALLIPLGYRLADTGGAAAGLCAVEGFVWLATWGWMHWRLGTRGHAPLLLRPTLAGGAVVALLLALPDAAPLLRAALATGLLLLLALLLDGAMRGATSRAIAVARRRPSPESVV